MSAPNAAVEAGRRLRASAAVIVRLTADVPAEQVRWQPEPGRWSILEVVCHLLDEEREDFRRRLELLLADPSRPWPPIDPLGWVTERDYLGQDPAAVRAAFAEERERSLAWLGTLTDVDWDASYPHPVAGALRAGDLLAAWQAHDLLHARQLTRLHYRYLAAVSAPYALAYAGDW